MWSTCWKVVDIANRLAIRRTEHSPRRHAAPHTANRSCGASRRPPLPSASHRRQPPWRRPRAAAGTFGMGAVAATASAAADARNAGGGQAVRGVGGGTGGVGAAANATFVSDRGGGRVQQQRYLGGGVSGTGMGGGGVVGGGVGRAGNATGRLAMRAAAAAASMAMCGGRRLDGECRALQRGGAWPQLGGCWPAGGLPQTQQRQGGGDRVLPRRGGGGGAKRPRRGGAGGRRMATSGGVLRGGGCWWVP